ncbi:MAG: hypothetical protein QF689_13630, partial [Candidatus Latescibacteria bacterium]|nr:hypothetical protein [Candidatus Latescibacterota bacterium]
MSEAIMALLPAPSFFVPTLAAYLPFAGPDMRYVYGLFATIVGIGLVMVVFRVLARLREKRQVQRSSWVTYEKVAKVKGLSAFETQLIGT